MRPIFLVLDPPDPETLSTRKLILESEKYNVLTAFTAEEAVEIASRVPINLVVLHDRIRNGEPSQLAADLKRVNPKVPVWVVSPQPHKIANVDQVISSFDPVALVQMARDMFGNYVIKDAAAMEKNLPETKK
jgi:DNA-binding response OmpR family regulator